MTTVTSQETIEISNIPLRKVLNVWLSKFELESNHVQNVPVPLIQLIISYFPVLIFEIPHATYKETYGSLAYIMRLHSNNKFEYFKCSEKLNQNQRKTDTYLSLFLFFDSINLFHFKATSLV